MLVCTYKFLRDTPGELMDEGKPVKGSEAVCKCFTGMRIRMSWDSGKRVGMWNGVTFVPHGEGVTPVEPTVVY